MPHPSQTARRSGQGGCLECAETAAEIIGEPQFDEPPKPKACGSEQITGPGGLLPRSSRIDDRPNGVNGPFATNPDGTKKDFIARSAGNVPLRPVPKQSVISEIRILRDESIPGISMKEAVLPARREMPIDEVVFFEGSGINPVRPSSQRQPGILPCAVVERQAMQGSTPLANKDWLLFAKDDEVSDCSDDSLSDSDGDWIEAGVPIPAPPDAPAVPGALELDSSGSGKYNQIMML